MVREIEAVLSKGENLFNHPLRVKWAFCSKPFSEGVPYNKILVLAPKRNFKKAVHRNLLKRRMREAYRLNKSLLQPSGINLFIHYVAKEILPYNSIEDALKKTLATIAERAIKKAAVGEKAADSATTNGSEIKEMKTNQDR